MLMVEVRAYTKYLLPETVKEREAR